MKKKAAVNVIGSMMAITLIGKVLGMLRDVMFANFYGTTSVEANAFLAASQIPRLFFDAVFASAISSSFIPVFNEYFKKKGKEEAYKFSDHFITLVLMITTLLTILGVVFSYPIVRVFVDQFDSETSKLCSELLMVLFPMLIFTGIAFSLTGILQSLGEFTIPAAMSIVSNGIIIFYYLFFNKRFGVFGLAITFLIGWAMQAAIQIPSLRKKGYRYRPRLNIKDQGLKKVGLLMLPVMVSTWVQPINIGVNLKFAAGFERGVAAINNSNNLYTIIAGTFVLSVANVIFPELSRLTEDKTEFGKSLGNTLKAVFYLLIPMMVGIIVLSEPIVRIVYERGEFSAYDTALTAQTLKYFTLGMLGFGMQNILSRGFYATQNGKVPLITGIISIGFNLVLSIILVRKMEIAGLALASALSSLLSGLMLLVPMQKKFGSIITKQMIIDLIKMVFSAIIMAIIVILSSSKLGDVLVDTFINRIIVLVVPITLGAAVYMILSYLIGLQEAKIAFGFADKFINKIRRA